MSDHLTPFEVAERQFGSQSEIERILGLKRTAGYVWQRATKTRAAGDFSSTWQQRQLLDHARKSGIVLLPEWLIRGATERDIEAEETRAAALGAAHARTQAAASPMEAAE